MFLHQLENEVTLVVLQDYHLMLAGQFAAAWGNADFDPADEGARYMARNHDAGWTEHDRDPGIDPSTGLPWHIVNMHPDDLNPIHRVSIERNAQHGVYTGILSCMHTMGFYNGRMGQSDFTVMDEYSEKFPEQIHPMVEECTNRIAEWKAELIAKGEDPKHLERRLWRSYRLLEAFDTMAIYFGLTREDLLGPIIFPNVPTRDDGLTSIAFTPCGGRRVTVDPYPFFADPLTVYLNGRMLSGPPGVDARQALAGAPAIELSFVLSSLAA